jgi:hypothetical protein
MAEPLGEVCSVTRRLLQRVFGLQKSRPVNVFFLAKGQILFEQPMYIYIHVFVKHFYLSFLNKGFAILYTVTIGKIFPMAVIFTALPSLLG